MIKFTTITGSIYQVDLAARTIERVQGAYPATARVGAGPRRFAEISDIVVGRGVLVQWGKHSATPAAEGAAPATTTSTVASIEEL